MALHIQGDDARRSGDPVGETVAVDRYWCLTEDKTRVVEEGHPDGRWLWASPGTVVSKAEAERLGALPKPEAKQKTPTEDKRRRPAANKQRSGEE